MSMARNCFFLAVESRLTWSIEKVLASLGEGESWNRERDESLIKIVFRDCLHKLSRHTFFARLPAASPWR
jgi:hypothetical protein